MQITQLKLNSCTKYSLAFLSCFILSFALTISAFAQTVLIDGWNVTYQGRSEAGGNTTFSYRACPSASGAGNITSFTLGVPSCFPPFEIVSVSPTTSVSLRRDDTNGAYGILWTGLSGTSCRDFSYTLKGSIAVSGANGIGVGLTDTDTCGGCCTTCGEVGNLPGPLCTVKGVGICGQMSRGDISIMFDQNACISQNGANAQRAAAIQFAVNQSALRVRSRIAIGSYHYGNTQSCDTTGWPQGYAVPYMKAYARYISLLNGTLSTPVTGWDYDGFLQPEHGIYGTNEDNSTKTFRALYGFANQAPFTCGTSSMGAALDVSGRHLNSGWADPQTPNFAIVVSNGRPNQVANGAACTGTTAGNSPCDCAAARTEAINQRNTLIAQGVRVFTVYLNDAGSSCSCTQAQIDAGKSFLQNQIASPNSYFEATTSTLTSVFNTINGLTQTFVDCDPSQFPNDCGANCDTTVNGGTCKPIACPSTNSCTPLNVNGAISQTDIEADRLNKKTVSATRVLERIKGKKDKTTQKFIRKARADAKAAYTKSWTNVFGLIPSTVYLCPSGCATQTTLVGSKSVVIASLDAQLAVFNRVTKQIRRVTKKSSFLTTTKRLEKDAKDTYANMRRLIDDVPNGSFGKNC